MQHVPYTLVCDFRSDCSDASDESFCVYPPCPASQSLNCGNKQGYSDSVVYPPSIVDFKEHGQRTNRWSSATTVNAKSESFACPETHFLCPGDDLICLPVFVRCNGVNDCPGSEDEARWIKIPEVDVRVHVPFPTLETLNMSGCKVHRVRNDGFQALQFLKWRFHRKSANLACAAVWVMGLIFAAVPLFPRHSHWTFYSHTGICIPLPVTRKDFAGSEYAYGILIVLNFVLFLMIAVGQVSIYASVRVQRMAMPNRKNQDQDIARRLLSVVVTDFLCWFPIGVLGLLASKGVAIPSEVNVAVAICVLPLNSAVNPLLYTLNSVLEKQRQRHERRLEQRLYDEVLKRNSEVS
nr:hypothetical protein BaRGS_016754 [Batillaria attramentaria]